MSSPSVSAGPGTSLSHVFPGRVLAQEEPTVCGPHEMGEDEAFIEGERFAERFGDGVTEARAHRGHPDDFGPARNTQPLDGPAEGDGEVEGREMTWRSQHGLVSWS